MPRTYGEDDKAKKVEFRDRLQAQIGNLAAMQSACRGKMLSVNICFFLYGKSRVRTRAEKDLDNMLKIVLDVLPDYMDQDRTEKGLGLMEDKKDHMIFEIHAVKRLVEDEAQEGIDIEVSEWLDESSIYMSS